MDVDQIIKTHKIPIQKNEDENKMSIRDRCFVNTDIECIEGTVTDLGRIFVPNQGMKDIIQVDHVWYFSDWVTKAGYNEVKSDLKQFNHE